MTDILKTAAYGGQGWSPRTASLRQEIGGVWGACGVGMEWSPLKAVLLHRPGPELEEVADPDAAQMLAPLDAGRARQQHDALAQAYRDAGVAVHYVEPAGMPPPNLVYVADYDKMEIDAVLMVLDGYFECEVTSAGWNPHPAIDLEIVGGYIVNEEGYTTWVWGGDSWGYWTFVTYDPRLMSMHPPYFPQTGQWDVAYWDERPDMVEGNSTPNGIAYNRI